MERGLAKGREIKRRGINRQRLFTKTEAGLCHLYFGRGGYIYSVFIF